MTSTPTITPITEARNLSLQAVDQLIAENAALTAQNAALMAERDALKAAKWDVQHVDTMNEIVLMGMARDAAIVDAATAFNRGLEEAAKLIEQWDGYLSYVDDLAAAIRALKSDSKDAGDA